MYDMYRWDQPAGSADSTGRSGRDGERDGQAAQAVQAALDRRDNGGDTAAPREHQPGQ
ncbi:MAG: hypothetical protein J2P32_06530 [Actinobacteria bacterium]|nr:hypothetical protein [Actinomycetota bacterium]